MEVKERLILRHLSGLYLSWSPDEYPLTSRLSRARRFYKDADVMEFMKHSSYRPDKPEEYEMESMKITFELEVNEDGGTEASKEAGRSDEGSEVHPEDGL